MIRADSLSLAARERAALASLPADDELVRAEHRRLVDAVEQLHRSAGLLGLDPLAQYAPFAVRADAWLYRSERDLRPFLAPMSRDLGLVA